MTRSWKDDFYQRLSFSETLNDEAAQKAYDYKNKHLPNKLYRYRSLEKKLREKQNLENDNLYLSSPENFNDPYDCACKISNHLIIYYYCTNNYLNIFSRWKKPVFSKHKLDYRLLISNCSHYTRSYLKKYEDEHHETPDYSNIIKNIRDDILISCFSECYTSTLMWSHYANEHKGICIEYNLDNLKGDIYSIFNKRMYPVLYSNIMADATQLAIDSIFQQTTQNVLNHIFIKPAVNKSIDWAYEKEWRIVAPRIDNRVITTPTPSRIILGSRISSEDEKWVREVGLNKGIPVVKAIHSHIYHSMNLTRES
ncbi:DUF2971 domain-containing protein [Cobetia sp. SIMBA_158]|uniref:DUF2971 domain-containing protein n=1 Tax=Cobetia sp. SIMBA_158 TaxID=3081617 RepID=UPI0039809409